MLCDQLVGTHERTIPANHDQSIDTVSPQIFDCFITPFYSSKILTSGGLENGAASLDDICDRRRFHGDEIALYQPVVSSSDSEHLELMKETGAHDRSNICIHSGRIPPGSQYSDIFNWVHQYSLAICEIPSTQTPGS